MEQIMNQYYIGVDPYGEPYIAHWGIKGQKWGIRRFQNPDGSLTEAGKKRYLSSNGEFDYKRRNAEGRKGASIYGKYVTYQDRKYMQELDDIANMPSNTKQQKKIKNAREHEVLTGWDEKNKNDPNYGDKLARSVALQHRIRDKSLDWYNSAPVSKQANDLVREIQSRFKAHLNHQITEKEYQGARERLYKQLDSIVLRDIGFEDTEQNRKLIRDYYVID